MALPLNLMALDVGERRIGLAVANSISKLSNPLKTILNDDSTILEIGAIISEEAINLLVVGLPKGLNGAETSQTEFSREFADKLKSSTDVPIYFEDEALSSVRAKKILDERKEPYEKGDIDFLAACYILDDFMANNKEVIGV